MHRDIHFSDFVTVLELRAIFDRAEYDGRTVELGNAGTYPVGVLRVMLDLACDRHCIIAMSQIAPQQA